MGIIKNILFIVSVGALCQVLSVGSLQAQAQKRHVIQFAGVVTTQDTLFGIKGAHIYVPKRGKGTTADYIGYFSFPVLEGG